MDSSAHIGYGFKIPTNLDKELRGEDFDIIFHGDEEVGHIFYQIKQKTPAFRQGMNALT